MKFNSWSEKNKSRLLDLMLFFKSLNYDVKITSDEVMFSYPEHHTHITFWDGDDGESSIQSALNIVIAAYQYYSTNVETITHEQIKTQNIDQTKWIMQSGQRRITSKEQVDSEEQFIESLKKELL